MTKCKRCGAWVADVFEFQDGTTLCHPCYKELRVFRWFARRMICWMRKSESFREVKL